MAFARVNTGTSGFISGSATTVATAATSLTAGNFIVAIIRYNPTGGISVTSVTDTAGNTYTKAGSCPGTATGKIDIWRAPNVLGNASNVVTAHFSASAGGRSLITIQYSGIATSSELDTTQNGSNSGASPITAASLTTATADELLIVAAQVQNTGKAWTAPGGPNDQTTVLADGSNVLVVGEVWFNAIRTVTASYLSADTTNAKSIIVAAFKLAAPATAVGTERASHVGVVVGSDGLHSQQLSHIAVVEASVGAHSQQLSHIAVVVAVPNGTSTQRASAVAVVTASDTHGVIQLSQLAVVVARAPKITTLKIKGRYSGGSGYRASSGEGTLTVKR